MQISSPLVVSPLADGVRWILFSDFNVMDDIQGLIRVPRNFTTDFGSIPQLIRNIISPTGLGVWGFTVHDWLYGTQTIPRQDADRVLLRLLKFCGENTVESAVIFDALQIAGELAWRGDEPNIAANLKLLEVA